MNFTQEELTELTQFSDTTIKAVSKSVTAYLHSGKPIANLFSFFKQSCINYEKSQSIPSSKNVVEWQQPIRKEETDFEFCAKVEPVLHRYLLIGHPGVVYTKPLADVRWDRLTLEQKEYFMFAVHTHCKCRADNNSLTQSPGV